MLKHYLYYIQQHTVLHVRAQILHKIVLVRLQFEGGERERHWGVWETPPTFPLSRLFLVSE